ncbi:hypothetical protein GCM10018965_015170 [Nonomuraea roseola]
MALPKGPASCIRQLDQGVRETIVQGLKLLDLITGQAELDVSSKSNEITAFMPLLDQIPQRRHDAYPA